MNRTISIILLIELFLTTTVFCRSRNDFISAAWPYLTLSWSSTADNLYDIKKFDPMISTSTFVPGKNYYDDRGEYIRNGTPGFSTALWPFEKDHTYTGMAYAYGGMDTPSGFATKLASSQKYIAGARDVDHRQHAPEGYAGYAGIDCSGLVSRLVGINDQSLRWNVANGVVNFCVKIDANNMGQGDLLVNNSHKHVVVYTGGNPRSNVSITHAVPNLYSDGRHVRSVVSETVASSIVDTDVFIQVNQNGHVISKQHYVYSPFPQIFSRYPEGTLEISILNPQVIPVKVNVRSNMGLNVIGMSEDGTLVTDQIEISNSGADYELKYVPLATAEAGTHNVSVSVQNAFGLQEYYEFSYTLVETADSDRDGMPDSWELEMGGGDLDPNGDEDSDSLTNLQEYRHGTNPRRKDSDGGGISDGAEVSRGTNPRDGRDDRPPPPPPPDDTRFPEPQRRLLRSWRHSLRVNSARDPNMMLGPAGQITPGQTLSYTVMFENIGEGPAYGVYVTDIFDEDIDDSSVVITNSKRIDYTTGAETPVTFEHVYDRNTRQLTVFVDGEGKVMPEEGGSFDIIVQAKGTIAPGTAIANYATVFFPSVPEETPTNTILSVVPFDSSIEYYGENVAEYSDAMQFSSILRDSNGKAIPAQPLNFSFGSSTASAYTSDGGLTWPDFAAGSPLPGEYTFSANYPGDGYYYLPSAMQKTIKILPKKTMLFLPAVIYTYLSTATVTVSVTDGDNAELERQQEEPKTLFLETCINNEWLRLAQSTVNGSSCTFDFSFPGKPAQLSYPLRARFDGDIRYAAATSVNTLKITSDKPPEITITSPVGGQIYAANISSITICYSLDTIDPSPAARALLTCLKDGATVEVANGQIINAFSLASGSWTFTVETADCFGNNSSTTTGAFEILHDIMPPRTSVTLDGSYTVSGSSVYAAADTLLTLSATDDLLMHGDGAGQGINDTFLSLDCTCFFTPYSGAFTFAAEGLHTFYYYSSDVAGNNEPIQSFSVIIDTTPPQTRISFDNPPVEAFGTLYLPCKTQVSLAAHDNYPPATTTEYRVYTDSIAAGAFILYDSTFSLPTSGEITIEYRSADIAGNAEPVNVLRANINAVFENAITAVGKVNICGNSQVKGDVHSNNEILLHGISAINGNVTCRRIKTDRRSFVTGTVTQNAPPIQPAPIDMSGITARVSMANDNNSIPLSKMGHEVLNARSEFRLTHGDSITLSSGTYFFTDMEICPAASVRLEGKVNILCTGAVKLFNNASLNADGHAASLIIFIDRNHKVNFDRICVAAHSRMNAMVYAPYSDVEIIERGIACGSYFCRNAKVFAMSSVLLPVINEATGESGFTGGKVYVYPNPSGGKTAPTFYVEAGIADRLEISVYNLEGDMVHHGEISGRPRQKSGILYYEYRWETGETAAGTYIAIIESYMHGKITFRAMAKLAIAK